MLVASMSIRWVIYTNAPSCIKADWTTKMVFGYLFLQAIFQFSAQKHVLMAGSYKFPLHKTNYQQICQ